jgi:uncharacterized membrane protein YhhN
MHGTHASTCGLWKSVRVSEGIAWAVVAGFAVLDWYAVWRASASLERLAKPATMLALIATAIGMGAWDSTAGRWLLAALALSLAGDVALLGDSGPRFLAGLGAFLFGHVAFVAAFLAKGLDQPRWSVVAVLVLGALSATVARRVLPAARREGGWQLAGPVAAYVVVLSAMLVTAWMTGIALVALGATVFAVSDSVLALDRFTGRRSWAPLAVMVTYHVAQALIVLGLLRQST